MSKLTFPKSDFCIMLVVAFGSVAQAQSGTGSITIENTLKINFFWPVTTIPTTTNTDRITHWMYDGMTGSTEVFADIKYGAIVAPHVTAFGLQSTAINVGTTKTLVAADLETPMYIQSYKKVWINGIPFTTSSWPLVKPNDIIRIESYDSHIMTPVRFQLNWTYTTPFIGFPTFSGTTEDRGMWNGAVLKEVTEAIVSGTESVSPMPYPMP